MRTVRSRIRTRAVTTVAVGVSLVLAACSVLLGEPGGDGLSAKSYLRDEVTIGVLADAPGWSSRAGGRWSGFDIDLAEWLAARYGFTPRYVPLADSERIPALESDRVQLVIATFSITDSRRQDIDFAGPYLTDTQGLLIRGPSIQPMSGQTSGSVCSPSGSTADARLGVRERERSVTAPSLRSCFDLLAREQVEAVAGDKVMLESFAVRRTVPDLVVLPAADIGTLYYGIGLPDNMPRLCTDLTGALSEFLRVSWQDSFERNLPGVEVEDRRPDPGSMFPCERDESHLARPE